MVIDSDESLIYLGHLSFALTGADSFIETEGQYSIDVANRRLTYRFGSGSDGMSAALPVLTNLWWDYHGVNRFENMEFRATRWSTSSSHHRKEFEGVSTFIGCRFNSGCTGIRGAAEVYDCRFERMTARGAVLKTGCVVERSFFSGMERSSAILIMCANSDDETEPVKLSVIRDCFFELPANNHGQGISLYHDAWQNAIIEHNIFLNCQRAFSFQPGGSRRTTPGIMRFENNLVVFDEQHDLPIGGQQTFSFNGGADLHLTAEQQVIIRSNTFIINPTLGSGNAGRWMIDLENFKNSSRNVENNIVRSLSASLEELDVTPQQNASNFMLDPVGSAAISELDFSASGPFSDYFDYAGLRAVGQAAYVATDGGSLGIRWGGDLSIDLIREIPNDWFERWPALPVPIADTTAPAWRNQDLR